MPALPCARPVCPQSAAAGDKLCRDCRRRRQVFLALVLAKLAITALVFAVLGAFARGNP